jgi:hypothetical protein
VNEQILKSSIYSFLHRRATSYILGANIFLNIIVILMFVIILRHATDIGLQPVYYCNSQIDWQQGSEAVML